MAERKSVADGLRPTGGHRINRVYSSGLEELVQRFLESLGKLNRAYLKDLQEKLLGVLEIEYERE